MTLDVFPSLVLTTVTDADWAGIAERMSVTGGVVLLAGCCVFSSITLLTRGKLRTFAKAAAKMKQSHLRRLEKCDVRIWSATPHCTDAWSRPDSTANAATAISRSFTADCSKAKWN